MRRLLLLFLLSSCTTPPGTNNGGTTSLLTYRVADNATKIEGAAVAIRIQITNILQEPLLLIDLASTDGTRVVSWQESRRGTLRYERRTSEYVYSSEETGGTEPVFNRSILAPGEQREVDVLLRLLDFPRGFTLRYLRCTGDALEGRLYFPDFAEVESGERFRPLSGEALGQRLPNHLSLPPSSRPALLFPHLESASLSSEILAVDFAYSKREYTLEQAGERIALSAAPVRYSYCVTFDAWVLQQERSAWLIDPREIRSIAPCERLETLFLMLDASPTRKLEVEFRNETQMIFADQFRIMKSRPSGADRWVAFVEERDWIRFLTAVGSEGLRMDVEGDAIRGKVVVKN